MTVRELIQILSTIDNPDEIRVMIGGYEMGYSDMVIGNGTDNTTPAIVHIALDVRNEWYSGRHEIVDNLYDAPSSNYHIVKAIIL